MSILQDEWGVIRDGVNSGPGGGGYASLGVTLRDLGSNIRSVMHRHRTTMAAVLYSAPFEQLAEQLQRLEKLVADSGSKRLVQTKPGELGPLGSKPVITLGVVHLGLHPLEQYVLRMYVA